MEEETEVLDWGNEDDEPHGEHRNRDYLGAHDGQRPPRNSDDADDVVSLGGEEDDMQELAAFQSRTQQEAIEDSHNTAPLGSTKPSQRESSNPPSERQRSSKTYRSQYVDDTPRLTRNSPRSSRRELPVIPGLPPKPTVAPPNFPPSRSPIMGASTMAKAPRLTDKERRRANGSPDKIGHPNSDEYGPLPPDWEVRLSRSAQSQIYYFNTRTELSQWTRPASSGKPMSPRGRSPRVSDRDRGRTTPSPTYPRGRNGRHPSPIPPHRERDMETRGRRPRRSSVSPTPSRSDSLDSNRRHRPQDTHDLAIPRRLSDARRREGSPLTSGLRAKVDRYVPDDVQKKSRQERSPIPTPAHPLRQEPQNDRFQLSRRDSSPRAPVPQRRDFTRLPRSESQLNLRDDRPRGDRRDSIGLPRDHPTQSGQPLHPDEDSRRGAAPDVRRGYSERRSDDRRMTTALNTSTLSASHPSSIIAPVAFPIPKISLKRQRSARRDVPRLECFGALLIYSRSRNAPDLRIIMDSTPLSLFCFILLPFGYFLFSQPFSTPNRREVKIALASLSQIRCFVFTNVQGQFSKRLACWNGLFST